MRQYKQRHFYIQDITTDLKALYSYNTLVGYQYYNNVLFTKRKYSPTTSKQCTMYTHENNLKRHNIDDNTLKHIYNSTFTHNKIDEINYILLTQN